MTNFKLTPEEAALVLKRDARAMDDSFNVRALCSGNTVTEMEKPPKKKAAKKKKKQKKMEI